MKKRDTYAYISILRGLWKDKNNLYKLFSSATFEEQQRILNNEFDVLWNDLWMYRDYKVFKDWYPKAKKKFGVLLTTKAILNSIHRNKRHGNDIWEFPKGKKNGKDEAELTCALREFTEETTIPTRGFVSLGNSKIIDHYQGTDRMTYETNYFVFYSPEKILPVGGVSSLLRQSLSEEAKECRWVTAQECKKLIGLKRLGYLNELESQSLPRA